MIRWFGAQTIGEDNKFVMNFFARALWKVSNKFLVLRRNIGGEASAK